MLFRGRFILALGAFVGLVASAAAFPDRPVQVIAPWAAGGGVDTVARIFAEGFEKELGAPVAVVNRTGGGGLTGHTFIATTPPDGYILGVASPEIAFYKPLGLGDFTPRNLDLFSRLSLIPAGVTVRADSPYKTLADFLKAVKESPKGTFMGSGTGTGGSWHIAAGGLLKAAGIEPDRLRWVPSQGGAPALQDLAAGGLTVFTGSPIEAKPCWRPARCAPSPSWRKSVPPPSRILRPQRRAASTGRTRTGSPWSARRASPRTAGKSCLRRRSAPWPGPRCKRP